MEMALLLLPKMEMVILLPPKMEMALMLLPPKMEMALLLPPKMEMALMLLPPKTKTNGLSKIRVLSVFIFLQHSILIKNIYGFNSNSNSNSNFPLFAEKVPGAGDFSWN